MSTILPSRPTKWDKGNYFGKEIRLLKLFGVSLTGNEGKAYKIYSFLIFLVALFVYPLLDTLELFKHDFSVSADIIIYQTGGFMTLAKAAAVVRKRVKLSKLLAKLHKAPFAPNPSRGGKVEVALVEECLWITNAQTVTYWILAFTTIIGAMAFTLIKRLKSDDYHDWQFGFGPFTVLNVTYSPNYEICWLFQNVSILYITALFTSVDLLLAIVLAHITYQFKILQNYIRKLLKISYKEMIKDTSVSQHVSSTNSNLDYKIDGGVIPWKYLHKSVRTAVLYHLEIISITRELEEAFSDMLLLVFLGTLTLLCFSVYNASQIGNNPRVAKYIGEIISASLQVVMVCYWGEQVVHESQQVGFAVYESNFVGTDLRYQKMLSFIIRRSQKPTKLTAGKFTDVCLTTFAWILRTSYSALMVLLRSKTKNI